MKVKWYQYMAIAGVIFFAAGIILWAVATT
jgi:hypothetical protein